MIRARFEFKIEDSWVGVFWKQCTEEVVDVEGDTAWMVTTPRLDLWICFVPWFPLHVVWTGAEDRSDAMDYIGDKAIEDVIEGTGWKVMECP